MKSKLEKTRIIRGLLARGINTDQLIAEVITEMEADCTANRKVLSKMYFGSGPDGKLVDILADQYPEIREQWDAEFAKSLNGFITGSGTVQDLREHFTSLNNDFNTRMLNQYKTTK